MNKKVVVLGGGTGLSVLLKGLKKFPLDITAVVAVSDDGGSSGKLREEFNIPAIGDLRNVIISLSETEPLVESLLQYRFKTKSDLNGHPTGNLLIAALLDITGNLSEAVEALGKVLNIKGKILPFTEDKVTLVAHTKDNEIIEGESNITKSGKEIDYIEYKEEAKVTPEVLKALEDADLIVMGIGSLYTSIIPNLLCEKVKTTIKNSKAKKLFISNIMTEHGETDNFKVSDFLKIINSYVGENFLDVVISNNNSIDQKIKQRYKETELSEPVILDKENIKKLGIKLIEDNLVEIKEEKDIHNTKRTDKMIRHNSLKLAFLIFSYLMNEGD